MSQDLIRIIDSICRDKNIEREGFLADLEGAMATAIRKAFETEDAEVHLDPFSGGITATVEGRAVDVQTLGRIAAQTAKQVIIQRTRERERASIFEDFTERRGTIVTGTVTRIEGGNLIVNIGRTEGFLPRSEQIPGETHQIGERIRVLILEVREQPNQVKIILSRSHPEFITRLFELEVPEVAERIIEIKALAREAGYRTKVAVASIDSKVDAVGACVGVRGSRIKNIVDELGGEKIDIVRWNESSQILIQNALKPAEVQEIALCLELGKATVVVAEDQLSLAIGKRGQNVRLAARLTRWDIDILTPAEYNKNLEIMEQTLRRIEGVDELMIDKLVAIGCVSVNDIDEIGPEPLIEDLELSAELAEKIVYEAGEEVIRLEEEKEAAAREAALAAERGETAPTGKEAATATDEEGSGQEPAADASHFVAAESADAGEAPEAGGALVAETDGETVAEAGDETATFVAAEDSDEETRPAAASGPATADDESASESGNGEPPGAESEDTPSSAAEDEARPPGA